MYHGLRVIPKEMGFRTYHPLLTCKCKNPDRELVIVDQDPITLEGFVCCAHCKKYVDDYIPTSKTRKEKELEEA